MKRYDFVRYDIVMPNISAKEKRVRGLFINTSH